MAAAVARKRRISEIGPTPASNPVPKRVRVADLFCGAGGTSTGARKALAKLGMEMDLVAVNHWTDAIKVHAKNHPDARHYNVNLDAARPEELVPEGSLDLLLASPECTNHSRAKGGRPLNDQSRASAFHIPRWCSALYVRRLVLENVPEWQKWGPLDSRGRPIKSKEGVYFQSFLQTLENMGYRAQVRILNAADHGDATIRHRLFVLARRDGRRIKWPSPTHSQNGQANLLGEGGQKWRSAREIIDWTKPSQSIFERKRSLSPKTLKRIAAGLAKYGGPSARPFLVMLYGTGLVRDIDRPLPTVTAGGNHFALVTPELKPFLVTVNHGEKAGESASSRTHSVDEPLSTITTKRSVALCEPFLVPHFNEREGQAPRCHSIDAPVPTVTSRGGGTLVEPVVVPLSDNDNDPGSFDHRILESRDLRHRIVLVGGVPHLLDLRLRMIEPDELACAMSFTDDDYEYEFAGATKTSAVKMLGNAVPVRLAAALVGAIMAD